MKCGILSKTALLFILTIYTALLLPTSVSQGALMGYVGKGTDIYFTDFETGQQTQITLSNLPSIVSSFEAFAISPTDHTLYAVGHWRYCLNVMGRQLCCAIYKIESTGQVSKVFQPWAYGNYGIPNLAFAPDGALYGFTSNRLLVGNVDTGDMDFIGVTSSNSTVRAFAIDFEGAGIVWNSSSTMPLQHIDLSGGPNSIVVGREFLEGPFEAFDYGPDGTLYGWHNRRLYEIDIDNLTATELGSFSHGDTAFALIQIPEPTTLTFIGFALLLGIRRLLN